MEVEGKTVADNEARGEGCPNSAITIRYGKIPVEMAVVRSSMIIFLFVQTTLLRKVEIDVYEQTSLFDTPD